MAAIAVKTRDFPTPDRARSNSTPSPTLLVVDPERLSDQVISILMQAGALRITVPTACGRGRAHGRPTATRSGSTDDPK